MRCYYRIMFYFLWIGLKIIDFLDKMEKKKEVKKLNVV